MTTPAASWMSASPEQLEQLAMQARYRVDKAIERGDLKVSVRVEPMKMLFNPLVFVSRDCSLEDFRAKISAQTGGLLKPETMRLFVQTFSNNVDANQLNNDSQWKRLKESGKEINISAFNLARPETIDPTKISFR